MRCSLVLLGFGKSNSASMRIQLAPADETVNRPARVLVIEAAAGGPPACEIEIAGRRTAANRAAPPHPVALPVGAPQQPVFGIHR